MATKQNCTTEKKNSPASSEGALLGGPARRAPLRRPRQPLAADVVPKHADDGAAVGLRGQLVGREDVTLEGDVGETGVSEPSGQGAR